MTHLLHFALSTLPHVGGRVLSLRSFLFVFAFAVLAAFDCAQAGVLDLWTFELSQPAGSGRDSGPYSPEIGIGAASGHHASLSTAWSSPVGNASAHSYNANNWSVGDYWQFSLSTLGNKSLQISFDTVGTDTGPANFKIAYSTNGTAFTDFANYSVVSLNWSVSKPYPSTTRSFDLSSITAVNNQPSVYFRLIDTSSIAISGGNVTSGGTNRIDNFEVDAVPEPRTWAAAGLTAGAIACAERQRIVRFIRRRRTPGMAERGA